MTGSTIGPRQSLYLGTLLSDTGPTDTPFYFDPFRDRHAPATGIGSAMQAILCTPGSGATLCLGIMPVYLDAQRGITQIVIDYSGEFTHLHTMATKLGLNPDHITATTIGPNFTSPLIPTLDPFLIGHELGDPYHLARKVCHHLFSEDRDATIVIELAINQLQRSGSRKHQRRCMHDLLDVLNSWSQRYNNAHTAARVAATLAEIATNPLGAKLFATGGMSQPSLLPGTLTIINASAALPPNALSERTLDKRLATVAAAIVTNCVDTLIRTQSDIEPKVLTIAAHPGLPELTTETAGLVETMYEWGRQRRCATRVLLPAEDKAIPLEWATELWCTRLENRETAMQVAHQIPNISNLSPAGGEDVAARLTQLGKGQFMFYDTSGTIRWVDIDVEGAAPGLLASCAL